MDRAIKRRVDEAVEVMNDVQESLNDLEKRIGEIRATTNDLKGELQELKGLLCLLPKNVFKKDAILYPSANIESTKEEQ